MRPRVLDLCCGAGGCAEGYHRAGFDLVGVDINPQPHYPFEFVQADAMAMTRDRLAGCWHESSQRSALPGRLARCLGHFDAIHASPPCQRWAKGHVSDRDRHPDLITPLRPLLEESGLPYVIENVPGAPLVNPIMLCGGSLGCVTPTLQLHRHRVFEANFPIMGVPCSRDRQTITVVGNGTPQGMREQLGRNPSIEEKREAMGIDWMNRTELSEAIPPAYTEHIGHYLMNEIAARAAA